MQSQPETYFILKQITKTFSWILQILSTQVKYPVNINASLPQNIIKLGSESDKLNGRNMFSNKKQFKITKRKLNLFHKYISIIYYIMNSQFFFVSFLKLYSDTTRA